MTPLYHENDLWISHVARFDTGCIVTVLDNNINYMNAVLIQIIFALVSFIMANPNIPQETKDQAMQLINDNAKSLRQEQVISEPVKTIQAPVTVVEPVAFSAPVEPTFVAPVATSTATSTVMAYIPASFSTSSVFMDDQPGSKFDDHYIGIIVVTLNDADIVKMEASSSANTHRYSSVRKGEKDNTFTFGENEEPQKIIFRSIKNGVEYNVQTYNLKVENGVATLY